MKTLISSLKIYLVLGLALSLILGFGFSCKKSSLVEDDEEFISNIDITYKRPVPVGNNEYLDNCVWLNICTSRTLKRWGDISNKKMEKIETDKFNYIVPSLPTDTQLWIFIQDFSQQDKPGGKEFNCRIIKVNGTELTNFRDDPWGNNDKFAYFEITKSGEIIQ